MTEQRTRLQEITAKLAHLCVANKTLTEELEFNNTLASALVKERSELLTGRSKGGCE